MFLIHYKDGLLDLTGCVRVSATRCMLMRLAVNALGAIRLGGPRSGSDRIWLDR
jgi:hypothetical protein